MRIFLTLSLLTIALPAQEIAKSDPAAQSLVIGVMDQVLQVIAPRTPEGLPIRVVLQCTAATGSMKDLAQQKLTLAYQHPKSFRIEGKFEDHPVTIGSDGTALWVQVPDANWLLQGSNDVPRFSTRPDSIQPVDLAKSLPALPKDQLPLLPALSLMNLVTDPNGTESVRLRFMPEAVKGFGLPSGELHIRLGGERQKPDQFKYVHGEDSITFDILDFASGDAVDPSSWKPKAGPNVKVEKVANAHLVKFLEVVLSSLGSQIPTLPPATGEKKLIASSGAGRLEERDGTRVLFLSGTPEEMGQQHGTLLKPEIRRVVDRVLYGVGVGSSFAKGKWFFGEIEQAQLRLQPFIDPRYTREADALALAAGLDREEIRLANVFPELFHCSCFALQGKATVGGVTYHGRVLDYLRGVGLEEHAVVIVSKPEKGNAWVNVSYAGMLGSVTAMNEKQISIGEMGGRGEGHWDGKPMTYLMREIMEHANTLDEAVAIMKKGPRTCEYYYVIADAKTKQSVGIKATPESLEVIKPGETHAQLPEKVEDAVLMSAGDRYTELVKRVRAGYGKFTADSARELMSRPVCMTSNIHSVLFCPDTLDFWVANADSTHVASEARYTKYNLKELLGR
jgi:isopenicillin-N N-acyltransferase-like protein